MSKSKRHQDAMNGELPSDALEVESILSASRLPTSSLDRDTLLFRAGQAAGEAGYRRRHGLDESARKAVRASESARTIFWSATSAVLAGSVVAMILTRPAIIPMDDGLEQRVPTLSGDRVTVTNPPAEVMSDEFVITSGDEPNRHSAAATQTGLEALRTRPGSLLTLRNQALAERLDDPWPASNDSTSSTSRPSRFDPPKTVSEMLRELSAT